MIIVTDKPLEIINSLMDAFGCGTTRITATGGYTNSEKTIIHFAMNRFHISRMKSLVHEIDSKAFLTISEVTYVFKANN